MYQRLNSVSSFEQHQAILINLTHNVNQRAIFAELQQKGALAPGVEHLSLYEACADYLTTHQTIDALPLPPHDAVFEYSDRLEYMQDGELAAEERKKPSPAGEITVRREFAEGEVRRLSRSLNGALHESQYRKSESDRFFTYYVRGCRVASKFYEGGEFRYGINYIERRRYKFFRRFESSFIKYALTENSLTFIDGVITAYLSSAIRTPKALFLHADHRAPDGTVVPRSKSLIEGFDGNVVVTTTEVHRARLEEDLTFDTPIAVIPHVITPPATSVVKRQQLCTVSRLELEGKPIHHAIEAFARIKDDIPGVDYLIYGSGAGQKALEKLISKLDCAGRIKLMGYTNAPMLVFQQSLASLYPTMTEGFGLAILESLACACPVITYDVDYGPREMIAPGSNGALLAPGDIEGLSCAILDCVTRAEDCSANCLKGLERFDQAAYLNNYRSLIKTYTDPARSRSSEKNRPRIFDDEMSGTLPNEITQLVKLLDYTSAPRPETLRILRSAIEENWDLAQQNRVLMEGYLRACDTDEDVDGVYRALLELLELKPMDYRPLQRMIWVTRALGDLDACHDYLLDFQDRFPEDFDNFIKGKPYFKTLLHKNGLGLHDRRC